MSTAKKRLRVDSDDATDDGQIVRVQDLAKAGIRNIVPGSPAAKDWVWFCGVYTRIIHCMARACRLPRDETEVLEDEVWVHLMNCLPRYRPDGRPGSFRRWLNTIVRRRAVDLFRQKKRQPTEPLTALLRDEAGPFDPAPEPADAFDRCWVNQQIDSVLKLMRETDPEHTSMFEQHYREGKSTAEIAAEHHCTAAHVATHVHRLCERLREALAYFIGEESK